MEKKYYNSFTLEDFIRISKENQLETYNYNNSIYINNSTALNVFCDKHQKEFSVIPHIHMTGRGDCPECRAERTKEQTKQRFIKSSQDKFPGVIDHTKTEYNGCNSKAKLFCNIHGYFEVRPHTHLDSAHGCTKCGALKATEIRKQVLKATFEADFRAVHGDKYDYSRVDYDSTSRKVEIGCPIHSYFWQTPMSHKSGRGCPKCAKNGYSSSRPGHFYILSNGKTTKVGITHQKVLQRIYQIHKSAPKDSLQLKVIADFFFDDGQIPRNLEKAALAYLRTKYQQVQEVFDGSTECFYDVDIEDLLAFVSPLSSDSCITTSNGNTQSLNNQAKSA